MKINKNVLLLVSYSIILILWSNYYLSTSKYSKQMKRKVKNLRKKNQPNIYINTDSSPRENIFERRLNNKLEAPEKTYMNTPNIKTPINVRTRGERPQYQSVGYLYDSTNPNIDLQRLQLFGRPEYYGSTQYEYYVSDNSRNNIKIPLSNTKEIYSNDNLTIPSMPGNYIVKIYDNDEAKYIPYLF